jgi:hypothetical protein
MVGLFFIFYLFLQYFLYHWSGLPGADNMLAKQLVDGVETRFVRDTNFNVLQERDGNNNVSRSYVWDEVSPGGIGGLFGIIKHFNKF